MHHARHRQIHALGAAIVERVATIHPERIRRKRGDEGWRVPIQGLSTAVSGGSATLLDYRLGTSIARSPLLLSRVLVACAVRRPVNRAKRRGLSIVHVMDDWLQRFQICEDPSQIFVRHVTQHRPRHGFV
jgi:hypothetical protein